MDDALLDAIEAVVDRRYAQSEGPATLSVELIRSLVVEELDREVFENEVEVACDELVSQGRLVFLRDHGKDGRLYCSTDIPEATVDLLREPME